MLLSLPLALACALPAHTASGVDSADEEVAAGPGALALSLRMDDDYLAEMDEPAIGTFYVAIYAEDDASATGPADGAVALADLAIEGVDLTSGGGPTGVLATTDPLDPQIVWVLGCLDTLGDDCDEGDPITIPNENKVEVVGETETPFEVYLGMLLP